MKQTEIRINCTPQFKKKWLKYVRKLGNASEYGRIALKTAIENKL